MAKFKIIGIAGTNGAGKDTVGHMLADRHNYLFISVTDLLRKEAERRGLPVARETLRNISSQWRRELGLGVLVDKAVAEYETVRSEYVGVVLASLRHPGEADRVHALGGTVIWIDADPRVRYERVQAAIVRRGRPEEDTKTFEQFKSEEAVEMKRSGDPATLDMGDVKNRSDIAINNDHKSQRQFLKDVERALDLDEA